MPKKPKRSKKTRRTSRSRKKKGTLAPWLSSVLSSRLFLNVLLVIMLFGFVCLGVERIWSYATGSKTFTVNTSNWDAELLRKTLPRWMTLSPDTINERISRDEYLRKPHSIFENNLEKTVAERYERLPWIRRVTRVEKIVPNRLRIEFTWRVPVARVRYHVGTKMYLVDEEGVMLEDVYDEAKLDHPLLFIEGVPFEGPEPGPGERWPQEGVAAAAALAKFLQPLLKELDKKEREGYLVEKITSIDVSNYSNPRRSRLTLKTVNKAIEWGNPVGAESPNEPSAEAKLANLSKLYDHSSNLSSWRDRPLKRRIILRWHKEEIVTSE